MPEEQTGAVYGSADGSFVSINYAKETQTGVAATPGSPSSSIFISRNQLWVIAATQQNHTLFVYDRAAGKSYNLGLPGVYRTAMNPGGSVMLAFVENSDYAYYPRKLQASESTSFAATYQSTGAWPAPYVDCEPKSPRHVPRPGRCRRFFRYPSQADSDRLRSSRQRHLLRRRQLRYILNCGPECGGTTASVTVLPTAPLILQSGQQSGAIPTSPTNIPVLGGASNALINSQIMYVMGQQLQSDGLFGGKLTVVNLADNTAGSPISISDSAPAAHPHDLRR